MKTVKLGIVFMMIVMMIVNVQMTQASVCGDSLDPETATVYHKHFDPESNITVALINYDLCNDGDPYHRDNAAIAFDGNLPDSFNTVDLYHLPNQHNHVYGDFFAQDINNPNGNGKNYAFWYLPSSEYITVTLSGSTHIVFENRSELQVYKAFKNGNAFELTIDPTDLVLLQNGIAEISEDYTIARQYINGRYYYYPYRSQPIGTDLPQNTVYLPIISR